MGVGEQEGRLDERAQWAAETRRADERCEQMNVALHQMQARLEHEVNVARSLGEKIKVRDEEILRLHNLHMPAQNLDKLNLKHVYEESQKSCKKLEA